MFIGDIEGSLYKRGCQRRFILERVVCGGHSRDQIGPLWWLKHRLFGQLSFCSVMFIGDISQEAFTSRGCQRRFRLSEGLHINRRR